VHRSDSLARSTFYIPGCQRTQTNNSEKIYIPDTINEVRFLSGHFTARPFSWSAPYIIPSSHLAIQLLNPYLGARTKQIFAHKYDEVSGEWAFGCLYSCFWFAFNCFQVNRMPLGKWEHKYNCQVGSHCFKISTLEAICARVKHLPVQLCFLGNSGLFYLALFGTAEGVV